MAVEDEFGIVKLSQSKIKDLEGKYTKKIEDSKDSFSVYTRTYCDGFDLGLTDGAGMPQGAAISFFAEPGTGKTTVAADIIKRILTIKEQNNEPYKVMYIDCEGSRQLLSSMGLDKFMDSGRLMYFDNVNTFAELEELYTLTLTPEADYFKDIKLIIVDSITAMQSKAKMNKDVDDGDFGSNAKERGNFYPKYLLRCRKAGITSIFISQVRCNIGAGQFESKTRAATTQMDQHYMDIIVHFSKATSKQSNGIVERKIVTATGGETTIVDRFRLTMSTDKKICKNRFGKIPEITMLVKPGKKIINTFTMVELLKNLGMVTGNASSMKPDTELRELLGLPVDKETGIKGKEFNKLVREHISEVRNRLIETDRFHALLEIKDAEVDGLE